MPRNGSGSYGLPAGNPVVPSTVISSTWANTTLSDIGTALTQSIANDGQTTPVANLPMATFRHTNVGNAVARTDYAAAGQVQDSSLQWLTSVAGTNTITASVTPSPTAYAAGQAFRFVSAGANTGAATLNINGLGAKAITKNGTAAIAAGDIASGAVVEVVYDGTQFQLMAAAGLGRFLGVQVFTSNGTYTPTPGTRAVVVECQGGGGGGGGAAATGAGQVAAAQGGQAGTYGKGIFTSSFSGVSVTVGAAGTAASAGNNPGGAGGTSSFGALLSCPGGAGGTGGAANAFGFTVTAEVGFSGAATGANIESTRGKGSGSSILLSTSAVIGGAGGAGHYGAGANAVQGTTGAAAVNIGTGGSGASLGQSSGGSVGGGAGAAGIVIVYEYS